MFRRSLPITRAEISLGGDLSGLFRDAPRVLAMALVWGFVADDEVCRGLGLPQWPWKCGNSLTAELRQSEKDRSPPRSQTPGDSFRAS